MRTAALVSLALVACVPDQPPYWLVDRPRPWGIRTTVVVPGPYSSDLVVPDDRERSAPLPLDTLELEWLEAVPRDTPKRPPPLWIVCSRDCQQEFFYTSNFPLLPECPDPLPLSRIGHACRLGQGERIDLVLGGAFSADWGFQGVIPIMAIGTADPDLEPDTCLERIRQRPPDHFEACLVQMRRLYLGPPWKVYEHIPVYANQRPDELPEGLVDEPADTHPILEHLHIIREPGGLEDFMVAGATLTVRPGDWISARPIFTADSYQPFHPYYSSGDEPSFSPETILEQMHETSALDAIVDGYIARGPNAIEWIAPASAEPVTLHLYIEDTRQGRLTASFHFVSEVARE